MKTLRCFETIAGLRSHLASRRLGQTIGLVPTMGALHPGHISLLERAIAENDLVVISIFINPLQFAPGEDLSRYPHQLEQDCQLCQELGVDVAFIPTPQEMGMPAQKADCPPPKVTVHPPAAMTSVLCAPFRPGHFVGVATVVTKLLHIVSPTTAYFGEKDAQQLAIISRLVADLNITVEIQACPTVREPSGLACSSRNQYLTPTEKEQAAVLWQSLQQAQVAFKQGEREAAKLIGVARQTLAQRPAVQVQYVELVHPQTLTPLEEVTEAGLLGIAAYIGSTRLIDSILLRQRAPIVAIDGPAGAGKSTVTRRVAKALNLLYLDTGAMYRAVTWLVMQAGIPLDDEGAIAELVSRAQVELLPESETGLTSVRINGEDVTEAIRTPQVTANVSQIAAQAAVRRALVKQQRRYGQQGGIVAEGRDIGTHVFPDAELKIFLTASPQERARRRWQDFQVQGEEGITLEELARDIQQRDERDSQRQISPLRKAVGALEIDTDGLSIEEVTEKIVNWYQFQGTGNS